MEMNQLKIELMQKIIACNDPELLLKLKELLGSINTEVNEEAEECSASSRTRDIVPDSYYKKLERDFEKYQKGEIKARSWEEIRAKAIKKYGI